MSKIWTLDEKNILIEKYADIPTIDLLAFLPDRTVSGITGHAALLGIKKSSSFYAAGYGGRITSNNDIGVSTRFKTMMPGWNKGKKQTEYMSAENIEKTRATRFKKGQDPHNTVAIGSERLSRDGYVEIKVRHSKDGSGKNKNFKPKHRVIYEAHYGPVPDSYNVEFVDGNKLNFDLENLIVRTRKESLLNNTMCDSSIVKRFLGVKEPELVDKIITEMPGLIELKRTTLKLNKKINKKDEKHS